MWRTIAFCVLTVNVAEESVLLLTQQSGQVWLYAALPLAVGVARYFVARFTGRRSGRDHEAGVIH